MSQIVWETTDELNPFSAQYKLAGIIVSQRLGSWNVDVINCANYIWQTTSELKKVYYMLQLISVMYRIILSK